MFEGVRLRRGALMAAILGLFIYSGCSGGDESGGSDVSAGDSCESNADCGALLCDLRAGVCVECFEDDDCRGGEACLASSGVCVSDSGTGGAGTGGQNTGTGGGNTGTGGGNTGTGGQNTGGGNTGTGGQNTGGGNTGTGGQNTGGGNTGGSNTGGSTGSGDTCNDAPANVVDNFLTCDEVICEVDGRQGVWFDFADDDINHTYFVGEPGSNWSDQSCAAVSIGGPISEDATATAFAGIGFAFNNGSPYDLSGWSGATIWLESDQDVWFVVKDAQGGHFGTTLAATAGNEARTFTFASLGEMDNSETTTLNLSQVLEFQFTATDPSSGFGYAIHRVLLNN